MKKIFNCIIIFITTLALYSCSFDSKTFIQLHESPQVYLLQDEDTMVLMPTVTLYENGNASLSVPPISSYGLFNVGNFKISENKLTITHNEDITATFEISNNGDMLTLLSTNLGFTKVGSVYEYSADADSISPFPTSEGELQSVEILDEQSNAVTDLTTSEPQTWLDYYEGFELPPDEKKELTLPEFPGVTFTWTRDSLVAGDKAVIQGMPIWNVFLLDLTNDGKPEFCATISLGSGIVDTRIIVYDYTTDKIYELSDRMYYDYSLSLNEGQLMVTQTDFKDGKLITSTELQLMNGEISRSGLYINKKL